MADPRAEYYKAYREANKARTSAYDKARYAANRDKIRAQQAAYAATPEAKAKRQQYMKDNADLFASYAARRRAWKKTPDAELVDVRLVAERDGWICWLCNKAVDPAVRRPDLMCKSIDHVKPLARGGSHRYDNVRLAHLLCNMQKHAKEVDLVAV